MGAENQWNSLTYQMEEAKLTELCSWAIGIEWLSQHPHLQFQ
jgi:hypothetical protein